MPQALQQLKDFFVPTSGKTPGLFQASTTIVSISAVYLYFAGYVYCYTYYYRYYAVTLESLDLSAQFYMMRAFTALNNALGICIVLVVLATVAAYLSGRVRASIVVLVMIAAFPGLYHVSYDTAMNNAVHNICMPRNSIRLRFKEPAKKDPGDMAMVKTHTVREAAPERSAAAGLSGSQSKEPSQGISLNQLFTAGLDIADRKDLMALGDKGELALLLETKDRIVLIRRAQCQSGPGPLSLTTLGQVFTLAKSDLEFTNITLQ